MRVTISVGGKFHAFRLAKELEDNGHLERIFTSYPWFSLKDSGVSRKKVTCLIAKEMVEKASYKIPRITSGSKISYLASSIFDWQVSRRIQPCDIFVGWSSFALYTLRQARSLFPLKVILERGSCHIETQRDILNAECQRLGLMTSRPCQQMVEKELLEYQEADYVSVPSVLAKDTFLSRGLSAEKIIQVPLGVDTQSFRPIPKQDSRFRVIFVGPSIVKGLHYFLQAIDELNIKGLEVWLVGGIAKDVIPFFKKYSAHFKHLGVIPNKDLYRYYSQASLFVNFALEDGFAMALLEAMACGVPVICTENTGAKDIVRDGIDGFILPIRNTEALKEKISYFYQYPQKAREMGRQARLRVESSFTWKDYGERIIQAYRSIAGIEEEAKIL
ncbi:glycosyltransferase family 1 protein [bacterium]|nr:MAG: glycosyltransferase family 1 protein [bacterium]